MDHDLIAPAGRTARDGPAEARPKFARPTGSGSSGSVGSAVTPGAAVGPSSAAVTPTGTTGAPTVTSIVPGRVRRSRVLRLPRIPRLRPLRMVVPVAIALLVWLLVVELIGAHHMRAVLSGVDVTSVVGALVVTQAASVGQAIALGGGVTTFIPFDILLRTAFAMGFAELIGGPVGTVATATSLHRQYGDPPAEAYSSALLSCAAGVAVPLLIGIGFLPAVLGQLHRVAAGPYGSNAALLQLLLLAIVATGLLGGLAFVVPRARHAWVSRRRPPIDAAWSNVYQVTSRVGPVVRLLAGPALMQLALALGLGWCVHAAGASVNFGALMLVCCAGSVLGGITPVPGGLGVVEATYISGLTLAGVPQDLAAVATLLFRTCSTYVPALWGWPALVWLRQEDPD